MKTAIPSAAEVRRALEALSYAQIVTLAERSGVPFNTLWNIRKAHTTKPGLDTVRAFMPHIKAVSEPAKAA